MTNKKFTIAAIAAAAITAAPIAAPVIGAITTVPVMAADNTATQTVETVTGSVTPWHTTTIYLNSDLVYGTSVGTDSTYQVKQRVTLTNGKVYYVTTNDQWILQSDVTDNNVKVTDTTTAVDTPASGSFRTGSISGATVYDNTGKATNQVLPINTNSTYTATATINGKSYYKIDDNMYILQSDVTATTTVPVNDSTRGIVYTGSSSVIVYNGTGDYVTNADGSVKTLPAKTNWKSFGKSTINGVQYYNVGGAQFVRVDAVTFGAGATTPALPTPTKFTAVGQVYYVPGYGIQVWTQSHKAVKNADGSNKKLNHGTSWKVFSKVKIGGETYYNVGGNQWVDSAYIYIK